MSSERQIELLPLDSLSVNDDNPKGHALDVIDSSVDRFGMVELIVRDERTGKIISGHGRRTALQQMRERGADAPDSVEVDHDGRWLVPVVTGWASQDDTEAAAALVALNRTTEQGGWVDDQLLSILGDIQGSDDGLRGVGFDDADLQKLRKDLDENLNVSDVLGEDLEYRIVIDCTSEQHQATLLDRLAAEGVSCRPLIS